MGATKKADFAFEPKVWQDHISAYFDKKLVFGRFAVVDKTLTGSPGETVTMPYFKQIGAAQEPGEDEGLAVDKLQDDSFSATIKEVGKAVGFKKSALRKSAARAERIYKETQDQIARVHAEKVDSDLITEINTSGNYVTGFTAATAATDKCNVSNMVQGLITAFGDKWNDVLAIVIHSLQLSTLLRDTTAGFLKGDASSPWTGVPGYSGTFLGKALIICDQVPLVTAVESKKTYAAFAFKAAPYGLMVAEEYDMESDYDMLHREYVVGATQWYAVKAFHAKVGATDLRIARMTFATEVAA